MARRIYSSRLLAALLLAVPGGPCLAGEVKAVGSEIADTPDEADARSFRASSEITRPARNDRRAEAAPIALDVAGKALADVLKELQARSGVDFDVKPDLADDPVARNIRETGWPNAFAALLAGYNYEAILGADGQLNQVIVSGRNGDGGKIAPHPRPMIRNEPLLSYRPASALPEKYRGLKAGSVVPIALPLERLKQMKRGESITLDLPTGQYVVVHDNRFNHENGDVTWVGSLAGAGVGYRVMITSGAQGSIGQIVTPDGVFNIEAEVGREWLIDINASGLRPGSLEHDAADPNRAPVNGQTRGQASARVLANRFRMPAGQPITPDKQATASSAKAIAAADGQNPMIDLLILYSNRMNNRTAQTRLNYLVDKANQAYLDSGIKLTLRAVARQMIDYTDENDNSVALDELTAGSGAFAAVRSMRQRYAADLVSLVRPFRSPQQNGCGISWINGSNGSPLSAQVGYSVVSDGIDGAWYCTDYTLAHELGHNMGSDHDLAHGGGSGHFPFSNGFGADGKFGTIMSYYDPQVGVFSDPNLTCNGAPCGDAATAYNTLSLTQTVPLVAGFYNPVPVHLTRKPGINPLSGVDLAVAVKVDKTKPRVGKKVSYTLTAKNLSPRRAENVALISTLFPNATVVSASRGCGLVGDSFICSIGTLTGKHGISRTLTVIAGESGTWPYSVRIEGDGEDPRPSNNQASVTVSVRQ